jgi:hypothetical protein
LAKKPPQIPCTENPKGGSFTLMGSCYGQPVFQLKTAN